jgi:hypothetical protein
MLLGSPKNLQAEDWVMLVVVVSILSLQAASARPKNSLTYAPVLLH